MHQMYVGLLEIWEASLREQIDVEVNYYSQLRFTEQEEKNK